MRTGRRHRGPVEVGLENDLRDHREIGPAERSALRAQARALDLALASADVELLSTASRVYLDVRTSAGLTVARAQAPESSFDLLLTELAKPGAAAHPGDAPVP